MTQKMQAHI